MEQRNVVKEEGSLLKEPTDQQREEGEEEGSILKEPTDRREEEESTEEPAGRRSEEPTDQRQVEEEEGSVLKEPTHRREEESSEEPAGRRSEEPTDARKEAEAEALDAERSSDEESMAASTLFLHPCSLLRYLVRSFACCLGMPEDSFGDSAKRSPVAAPASVDSSPEGVADRSTGATGFYMQEVITRVWAVRRPRPSGPGNPREGSGGNGGHHH